ncbi:MAG TPA: FCD domain-containing protein, partial [Sphingomonas sp.]|nr:FCD domain-containing protein [Sphingomonas sp.]
ARRSRGNLAEARVAYHLAILAAARNPFYAQFRDLLATALRASSHFPGRLRSLADHASVFEAIRDGDPGRARRHMRGIIDDAFADIRRATDRRRDG